MGDGGSPTVSTFDEPNPPGAIPGTTAPFAPCFIAPDYGSSAAAPTSRRFRRTAEPRGGQ